MINSGENGAFCSIETWKWILFILFSPYVAMVAYNLAALALLAIIAIIETYLMLCGPYLLWTQVSPLDRLITATILQDMIYAALTEYAPLLGFDWEMIGLLLLAAIALQVIEDILDALEPICGLPFRYTWEFNIKGEANG